MVVGSQLRMVLECDEGCHGTNKRMQARKSLFSAGTTVTGLTTVYATPTDVDTMRLWHMRLNHMSEKGMTILSEKDRLVTQVRVSWSFVIIMCLGKRIELVSLQLSTIRRGSLITSILTCGVFRVFPHLEVSAIC